MVSQYPSSPFSLVIKSSFGNDNECVSQSLCHTAWEEGLFGTASRRLTSLGSGAFALHFSSSLELGLIDGAPVASCILK